MNALVPKTLGPISNVFAGRQAEDDLSAGVQASFGLIGYKGKVWSIKYRGNETPLLRDDGDGPRNSIEVVILKSPKHIAKIWYEQGYTEGSTAAPDCFSNNGVVPEPSSRKLQSPLCASCPRNVWGSRITPAGKAGKECADNKRLAIVPLLDIKNEGLGGPMLLRVPAASLQDLSAFGMQMQQMGYPYYSIGIKIAFDPQEAYPKFVFSPIRPLTDEEGQLVLAMRENPLVDRILSETPPDQLPQIAAPVAQPQPQWEQPLTSAQTTAGTGAASTTSAPPVGTTGANPSGLQSQTSTAPASPAPPASTESPSPPAGGASPASQTGFGRTAQQSPSTGPSQTDTPSTGANASPTPATTGFGRTAGEGSVQASAQPVVAPQPQPQPGQTASAPVASPQQVQQQPLPQTNGAAPAATSHFEDDLDAQLAALLPT